VKILNFQNQIIHCGMKFNVWFYDLWSLDFLLLFADKKFADIAFSPLLSDKMDFVSYCQIFIYLHSC